MDRLQVDDFASRCLIDCVDECRRLLLFLDDGHGILLRVARVIFRQAKATRAVKVRRRLSPLLLAVIEDAFLLLVLVSLKNLLKIVGASLLCQIALELVDM